MLKHKHFNLETNAFLINPKTKENKKGETVVDLSKIDDRFFQAAQVDWYVYLIIENIKGFTFQQVKEMDVDEIMQHLAYVHMKLRDREV